MTYTRARQEWGIPEGAGRDVGNAAHLARVLSQVEMAAHVHLHVVLAAEALAAVLALEGACHGVYLHVRLKVVLVLERAPALVAHLRVRAVHLKHNTTSTIRQ